GFGYVAAGSVEGRAQEASLIDAGALVEGPALVIVRRRRGRRESEVHGFDLGCALRGRADRRGLYAVRQLADVTRPVRRGEGSPRARRQLDGPELVHTLGTLAEVAREVGDVLPPLGERRYADRQNLQPVEQVLTEALCRDGFPEIHVG